MIQAIATEARRRGPRQYAGRCLCGAVRYQVELDPHTVRATCHGSVWERKVPAHAFRILCGEESLSGHQFSSNSGHYFFCECCGVRPFSRHNTDKPGREYYLIDLKWLG